MGISEIKSFNKILASGKKDFHLGKRQCHLNYDEEVAFFTMVLDVKPIEEGGRTSRISYEECDGPVNHHWGDGSD